MLPIFVARLPHMLPIFIVMFAHSSVESFSVTHQEQLQRCTTTETLLPFQGLERFGDTGTWNFNQEIISGDNDNPNSNDAFACYCRRGGRHSSGLCNDSLLRTIPTELMYYNEKCALPTCGGSIKLACHLHDIPGSRYVYGPVCRDYLVLDEITGRCVPPAECTPREQSHMDRLMCQGKEHMFHVEWPYKTALTCKNPSLYTARSHGSSRKLCVCGHGRVVNRHEYPACVFPIECDGKNPQLIGTYPESDKLVSKTQVSTTYPNSAKAIQPNSTSPLPSSTTQPSTNITCAKQEMSGNEWHLLVGSALLGVALAAVGALLLVGVRFVWRKCGERATRSRAETNEKPCFVSAEVLKHNLCNSWL